MGYTLEEFKNMTWEEFDWNTIGYERRMARNWDYVRNLIAAEFNSSGFAKKTVKAKDIMQLPLIDSKEVIARQLDEGKLNKMLKIIRK